MRLHRPSRVVRSSIVARPGKLLAVPAIRWAVLITVTGCGMGATSADQQPPAACSDANAALWDVGQNLQAAENVLEEKWAARPRGVKVARLPGNQDQHDGLPFRGPLVCAPVVHSPRHAACV